MPRHPHDDTEPSPEQASPPVGVRLAPGLTVPEGAFRLATARSSGPGGQNVNKRSTKVELRLSLAELSRAGMSKAAIARLKRAASHLIVMPKPDASDAPVDPDAPASASPQEPMGELVITAQDTRSQARNREAAIERLRELVRQALVPPKPRRPTKPGRGAVERRLKAKREAGEKKDRRRWRPSE
ncbi:MAG: hypothetical protein KDA20_02330 [Phycisphaerales bacterium]|nr:hypothetical protein [Phycisphaerales bacterium]